MGEGSGRMVSWIWIPVMLFIGEVIGFYVAALIRAGGDSG